MNSKQQNTKQQNSKQNNKTVKLSVSVKTNRYEHKTWKETCLLLVCYLSTTTVFTILLYSLYYKWDICMCCYKLFFIFNLHDSPIHQRREVFAGRGRRRLPCRLFLSELNFFHHLDLLWDVSLSNSESLRSDVRRALPLCTPASARKRSRPTCCSLLSHDPFLQGYT